MDTKKILFVNGALIAVTVISGILYNRRLTRKLTEEKTRVRNTGNRAKVFVEDTEALIAEVDRRIAIAKQALAEDDIRILNQQQN